MWMVKVRILPPQPIFLIGTNFLRATIIVSLAALVLEAFSVARFRDAAKKLRRCWESCSASFGKSKYQELIHWHGCDGPVSLLASG
jgi:hypothetical protein